MTSRNTHQITCSICGKSFAPRNVTSGELIRKEIADEILKSHSDWSAEKFICKSDLAEFRSNYVHSLLESEKGELSSLEQEVIQSLHEHELVSEDVESQFEQKWTFGVKSRGQTRRFSRQCHANMPQISDHRHAHWTAPAGPFFSLSLL